MDVSMDTDISQAKKLNSKPRARGRPRKKSADEPQEDRRERARRAQKNYQLRKQADNDSLKKRVAFLQSAIELLSNEFVGLGDRIVRSKAENQILNDLRTTTQKFLEIARATGPEENASPPLLEEGIEEHEPENTSRLRYMTPLQTTQISQSYFEGMGSRPNPNPAPHFNSTFATNESTTRWSPKIGYGFVGLLSGWDPEPEQLWKTYSVAGPNSFAMRIYSDAIKLLLMLIRGQVAMPGVLPNIGRYRFRHEDPRILVTYLEDHLSNVPSEVPGVVDAPSEAVVLHGPRDREMTTSLRRAIFRDVSQETGSMEGWLDPFHAQKYLVERWQIQLTSDSAQVSTRTLRAFNIPITNLEISLQSAESYYPPQNSSLWGGHDLPAWDMQAGLELHNEEFNLLVNAQPLAQSLVSQSVCFGEGPRFYAANIDKAVIEFLSGISDSAGVLTIPFV